MSKAIGGYVRRSERRSGHVCGPACSCPVHGTPLLYSPYGDEHACQDATCVHAHGFESAGVFLTSMLGVPEHPGPPYVHTMALPPEPWYSKAGKLVYRPPASYGFTMSGPEVGHGTPPPQPAPHVRLTVGEPLGPPDEFRWTPGEDGNDIYPEPGPAYTLTEGP